MTFGQETRWAYSTTLQISHVGLLSHGTVLNKVEPVAKQHFRATILHSATERRKQTIVIEECRSTKVDKFNTELFIDDNVLVFDVAMYNAERTEIRQSRHQLRKQTHGNHSISQTADKL